MKFRNTMRLCSILLAAAWCPRVPFPCAGAGERSMLFRLASFAKNVQKAAETRQANEGSGTRDVCTDRARETLRIGWG